MRNLEKRIARLEEETPSIDQDWSLQIIKKWIESHKEPVSKITPEERKRFDALVKLSNSMSKAK